MTEDIKHHIKRWKWGALPNKYQVGPMILFREIQMDNYFIMKLFRNYMTENEYPKFYQYHLDYYMASSADATKEKQFKVIWNIIVDGIRIQERHPHSELAKKRKKKMLSFQAYLKGIDQWSYSNTNEELVDLKNQEIDDLKKKLGATQKELSKLKVDYKIRIKNADRTSIFHLFLQMRDLSSPKNGSRVFNDPAQSTWAKILANHFEDDKPIPFDTALNYFRGKSKIHNDNKLFELK